MRRRTTTNLARHPRSVPKRYCLLLVGSMIATTCYALTIRAQLGLGPLFVLQDGFSRHTGLAIGSSVTVTGLMLVVVALLLRVRPGVGTLVLPVFGGATLDGLLPHVPTMHGWALRASVVVAASWMMALGGAIIIRASVGVAAYDAVMLGLRRVTGRPLAPIRLAMEATVLAGGWLLGGSVGLGTAVTGLLIGPGIQFWLGVIGDPSSASTDGGRSGVADADPESRLRWSLDRARLLQRAGSVRRGR